VKFSEVMEQEEQALKSSDLFFNSPLDYSNEQNDTEISPLQHKGMDLIDFDKKKTRKSFKDFFETCFDPLSYNLSNNRGYIGWYQA